VDTDIAVAVSLTMTPTRHQRKTQRDRWTALARVRSLAGVMELAVDWRGRKISPDDRTTKMMTTTMTTRAVDVVVEVRDVIRAVVPDAEDRSAHT